MEPSYEKLIFFVVFLSKTMKGQVLEHLMAHKMLLEGHHN